MNTSANVVVIAGPNGSGKTTMVPVLLRDYLGIREFVNADTIAQGLSAFDAEGVAFRAGRLMLDRLRELEEAGADFAFETTLASRTFSPWLENLRGSGYRVHILFLWLPSPEMAVARVAARVERGGHHVADDVVRRRYRRGIANFFAIYRSIADVWAFFDNSSASGYELIAGQTGSNPIHVAHQETWTRIQEEYA
jgi:predicted ABC-type ATPase